MPIDKFIAADFSNYAYDEPAFTLPQSYVDAGWQKMVASPDIANYVSGYFGVAYVRVVAGVATDLVIAHRGTEPTSVSDLVTDLQLSLGAASTQVPDAIDFVGQVRTFLSQRPYGNGVNFNAITTQTGHSLGGYLAIYAANDIGAQGTAITFDNPASNIAPASITANIVSYLNRPNFINTGSAGTHTGTIYRVDSDVTFARDNEGFSVSNMLAGAFDNLAQSTINIAQFTDLLSGGIPLGTNLAAAPFAAAQTFNEHRIVNMRNYLNTAALDTGNHITNPLEQYLIGDYRNNAVLGGIARMLYDGGLNTVDGVTQQWVADSIIAQLAKPGYNPYAQTYYFSAGTAGNDILGGTVNNDLVAGFAGNDRMIASEGRDALDGLQGSDTIAYQAMLQPVNVDMSAGNTYLASQMQGGVPTGQPKDIFVRVENIEGSGYGDTIFGSTGANFLDGKGGNDDLDGSAGRDTLQGGIGNDTLTGGTGDDFLVGGADVDTYIYSTGDGSDIISDRDGIIQMNGQTLSGVAHLQASGTSYLLNSGGVDYILSPSGSNLVVRQSGAAASDKITIRDFHNGAFGISLNDQYTSTVPTTTTTGTVTLPPQTPLDNDANYELPWDPSAGEATADNPYGGFAYYGANATVSPTIEQANNDFATACKAAVVPRLHDPLVLDYNGDGIRTISYKNSSVFYDWGIGTQRSGWTYTDGTLAGTDGFLVIPRPGQPITIGDMFGSQTMSGFNELKLYDVNGDNVVDLLDPIYPNISLWRDVDGNGISTPAELTPISMLNVTSLATNPRSNVLEYTEGNIIAEDANAIVNNQTRRIGEMLFAADQQNTILNPVNSTNGINPETLFLPYSRGYSTLPQWHVAMTDDGALLSQMQTIANLPPSRFNEMDDLITNYIYRWAGVEGVSPTAFGADYMDGRKMTALQKLTNVNYGASQVSSTSVQFLLQAWDKFFSEVAVKMVTQGTMRPIFSGTTYSFNTDAVTFLNDLDQVIANARNVTDGDDSFWRYFGHVVERHAENFVGKTKEQVMHQAGGFIAEQMGVPADQVAAFQNVTHYQLAAAGDTLFGGADNDYLHPSSVQSMQSPFSEVQAWAGDDVLDAGDVNNILLNGNDGDDTYRIGNVNATIYETPESGRFVTNSLHLLGNVSQDDVTSKLVSYPYQFDWVLGLPNGNRITVTHQFTDTTGTGNSIATGGSRIQELHFVGEGKGIRWTNNMRYGFRFRGDYDDTFMQGTGGNDIFYGIKNIEKRNPPAATIMAGDQGDDTYCWSPLDGNITISESGSFPPQNRLNLGAEVDPNTILSRMKIVSAGQVYYHWYLEVPGNFTQIWVVDAFGGGPGVQSTKLSQVYFQKDGTRWDLTKGALFRGDMRNDTLQGTVGDDTLIGGGGIDQLYGDVGRDEYHWDASKGSTKIADQSVQDNKLVLNDPTITKDNFYSKMEITNQGVPRYDWKIGASGTNNTVYIYDGFAPYGGSVGIGSYNIAELVFADGSRVNVTQGALFRAKPGGELLYGTQGADEFFATTGPSSTYAGGNGNDIYHFDYGNGNIYVSEPQELGAFNKVVLGAGITPDKVTFQRSVDDLLVILDSGETLTLGYQFQDFGYGLKIKALEFADGTTLDMTALQFGTAGNNLLQGTSVPGALFGQAGNDTLIGGDGGDLLVDGLGNDSIVAGFGADHIVITPENGATEIISNFNATQGDKIDLSGFDSQLSSFNQLPMTQNGTNVVIDLPGGQTVTLLNTTLAEMTPGQFIGNVGHIPAPTPAPSPAPLPAPAPAPAPAPSPAQWATTASGFASNTPSLSTSAVGATNGAPASGSTWSQSLQGSTATPASSSQQAIRPAPIPAPVPAPAPSTWASRVSSAPVAAPAPLSSEQDWSWISSLIASNSAAPTMSSPTAALPSSSYGRTSPSLPQGDDNSASSLNAAQTLLFWLVLANLLGKLFSSLTHNAGRGHER